MTNSLAPIVVSSIGTAMPGVPDTITRLSQTGDLVSKAVCFELNTKLKKQSVLGLEFDSFCDGLIDAGISRVPPAGVDSKRPRYQGSAQTHYELLEYARTVIKKMAEDPQILNAASPTMFHPDLHKRNIFVSEEDPTVITAIIDWQSTSIEPAFSYANEVPDFARFIPNDTSEGEIDAKGEACAKAFNVCT